MATVFEIVESPSARLRLEAAAAFLRRFPPHHPITIVAATRGAADDLARHVAIERGATVGLSRFGLTQLAARAALTRLAGRGVAAATALGSEAVAARAAFDATRDGTLTYLDAVAKTPGFPRALARTIGELRLAGVRPGAVSPAGSAGADLSHLLAHAEHEFDVSATADRAALFGAAAMAVPGHPWLAAPLVLLDVGIESSADAQFVAALTSHASEVLATVPLHDEAARRALADAGGHARRVDEPTDSDLSRLRAYLFADETPPAHPPDGSLEFFSAPGEGRECVEIARRVLSEARRGVRFDEMAILVRAPQHYQGLMEHALNRAGIPAWFDRGTRRPHPAGRAFLALLACAAEQLSARRFAEYLSLGQLPSPDQDSARWVLPTDDVVRRERAGDEDEDDAGDEDLDVAESDDASGGAVVAGTLRAPRRWERLLVDAAVIGGSADRWTRRLDGLANEFTARLAEARRNDEHLLRVPAIERDLDHLHHLRAFALPLIEEMAAWPASATWGDWLTTLEHLVPRVLRTPAYVLRVLADLRPMAAVGPVSLEEVRSVLSERLRTVDAEPPARRYGRLFVGSPAQARGRAFRVVFVPGLAERLFPQKQSQDPLLLDAAREHLVAGLPTRAERGRHERLLLHLAVGAATERLCVSYPRLEVAEGRVRVPSFYALDVVRGASGRVPDHETLTAAAAEAGDSMLAWPAPSNPDVAIDDQEHDLAVLRALLEADDANAVRGRAQYMLRLNPALRRSVTERWARGERRWSQFDGLIRVTDATRDALARQRLGVRPYSVSALQRYAACPYQFLLGAIYRLHEAEEPLPLQRLDPLTKGSIVHRMQAQALRALKARHALPVTPASLDAALRLLDDVVGQVAAEYEETLAPAIERVWREEIGTIARDLRGWLHHVAEAGGPWVPQHFELSFGLAVDADHDPGSTPDPVSIDGRFLLRGSVDLVEEHATDGTLRVTDHKTGKDRTKDTLVIGGGTVLQPVLYSLAVEAVTGRTVAESRLFFCTTAGGYKVRPVALTLEGRRAGIEALEIIDRALEQGFLAAAPAEAACARCEFRPVCGPAEEQRVARKPPDRLHDLIELRSRP